MRSGSGGDGEDAVFGGDDDPEMSPYAMTTEPPQYEPLGLDVCLDDCLDRSECERLISSVESADVPQEVKDFLRYASYRFLRFDYRNIAEYYARASPEVQRLFEDLAPVIIDFDDALKRGFIEVTDALNGLMGDPDGEGND